MVIVTAMLGRFKGYRSVFYRVYLPEERNSNRKSYLVVSNFGPLAVAAAHLEQSAEMKRDAEAALIFLVPPTLPHELSDTKNRNSIVELLSNPKAYLKKFWEELRKNVDEAAKKVKEELENEKIAADIIKRDEKVYAISIVYENSNEDIEIIDNRVDSDQNHLHKIYLPYIIEVKRCEIKVNICKRDSPSAGINVRGGTSC